MKVEIGKDFDGVDSVILNIGQFRKGGPLRYIYLTPEMAIQLAEQLTEKAHDLQESTPHGRDQGGDC